MVAGETGANVFSWRPPAGDTLDWQTGIEWNVSVPDVPSEPVSESRSNSLSRVSRDILLAAGTAGPQKAKPDRIKWQEKTAQHKAGNTAIFA